jgi:hypothetical protein
MNRPLLCSLAIVVASAPAVAQAAWAQRQPGHAPSPREEPAMVYDPLQQRVVLFGGGGQNLLGDTWLWDGTDWTQSTPGPSPRNGHAMVFDAARGRVMLFGGADASGYRQDTWELIPLGWIQRFPATSPPPRLSFAMAYDPLRQRTVLFGGRTPIVGDLWEWDGTNWQQRSFVNGPTPRAAAMMAWDPTTSAVLMFGGADNNGGNDEVWTWDGTQWLRHFPTTPPHFQAAGAMVTDVARGRVVLFGGATPDPYAWEWDGNNWRPQLIASPATRYYDALAYDSVRREVVLFGGMDFNYSFFADTWAYATASPADFQVYGAGCVGSAGIPALGNVAGRLPWIGDTLRVRATGLASASSGAVFVTGLASTAAQSLAVAGLPGCSSYVTLDSAVFAPAGGGSAELAFAIPNTPALAGAQVFQQVLAFDDGVPGGAVVSNAAVLTAGIR